MASGYYDITTKILGKGHYGVVKLGRHCLTGQPVAIKIIEKSRISKDCLNQLGTEIRILFRLSEYEHPNILKLYQTIDTEDKLFLVTEYCGPHACDLYDYILRKHSRDGLSGKESQIFFIQICSAISYCHSMGIVHRDLKPENILVTDYKHIYANSSGKPSLLHDSQYPLLKLIDFGFANQWYPDEKMRTSCGTLAYSAPELLLGEAYDGTKVDVWGLGLMLYILLYGGNPFMQINDNETLTKILDCSFSTPEKDNVDANAVELLRSLITRDPDARLSIDAILQHKWFQNLPQPLELTLGYHQSRTDTLNVGKQQPKQNQVATPTLPSISESGPLKNLNESIGVEKEADNLSVEQKEVLSAKYKRSRSLSITRTHPKLIPRYSLPQNITSHSMELLNKTAINAKHMSLPLVRGPSRYRPTSPDVGGENAVLSEAERRIHDSVIQEILKLSKLSHSGTTIEASLRKARLSHRQFNHNSIQPARHGSGGRKFSTGSLRTLLGAKANLEGQGGTNLDADRNNPTADKLGLIDSKLSDDDYIYATYQLTRDRILRLDQKRSHQRTEKDSPSDGTTNRKNDKLSNQDSIPEEGTEVSNRSCGMSAKENNDSISRPSQRKSLQPQHRMRDKFTSFFRSGSTSPNGSFNWTNDSLHSGTDTIGTSYSNQESPSSSSSSHHDAFNEQTHEFSTPVGRYFANRSDPLENSMAYALPLARKCSLVSEESGCSNEPNDN